MARPYFQPVLALLAVVLGLSGIGLARGEELPSHVVANWVEELGDANEGVRTAAGRKLLDAAPQLESHAHLLAEEVARSKPGDESDARTYCRRALLRIGGDALPAVIAHLPADDELIAALAEPGDTKSIAPLVALLATNKASSQAAAAGWKDQKGIKQALLMIGPRAIVKPLTEAVQADRDSLSLFVALCELAGPEFADTAPLLASFLSDEREDRCLFAGQALARIGAPAIPVLAAALKVRDRREAAMYAIEEMDKQASPLAEQLFELTRDEALMTNERVLSHYDKKMGEFAVGELAARVHQAIRPAADRFLVTDGEQELRAALARSVLGPNSDSLRPGGTKLADLFAESLSSATTAERVDRLCRQWVYDAGAENDQEKNRRARRGAIFHDRFFCARVVDAWSSAAPDDPRLVEATLRLIGQADYRTYPDQGGDSCGGLEWPELLFLREPVQTRPQAYLPRLREMLSGDEAEQTKALYMFAHLGPHGREAVDAAFAAMRSESYDARRAALLVLDRNAPPSDRLVKTMFDCVFEWEHETTFDVYDALGTAMIRLRADRQRLVAYLPRLISLLATTSESQRDEKLATQAARAATLLGAIGPDAKTAAPTLLKMANCDVKVLSDAAVLALAEIDAERTVVAGLLAKNFTEARESSAKSNSNNSVWPHELLVALGKLGAGASSQAEFVAEIAVKKPLVICNPETADRELADRYELQCAVEAAIALGRIGPAARSQLSKLRETARRQNLDPLDQPRQLAMAVAMMRLSEQPTSSDVLTVLEVLRVISSEEIADSVVEDLAILAKSHPEIGRELRRHYVRSFRPVSLVADLRGMRYLQDIWRTWTGSSWAHSIHAALPGDPACREAVEDSLAAELAKDKRESRDVESLLAILRTLEDRSPRLVAILKTAADHAAPNVRWQTAALLEEITAKTMADR